MANVRRREMKNTSNKIYIFMIPFINTEIPALARSRLTASDDKFPALEPRAKMTNAAPHLNGHSGVTQECCGQIFSRCLWEWPQISVWTVSDVSRIENLSSTDDKNLRWNYCGLTAVRLDLLKRILIGHCRKSKLTRIIITRCLHKRQLFVFMDSGDVVYSW